MNDEVMILSSDSREQLKGWMKLRDGESMPLTHPSDSVSVATDASLEGIGIFYKGCLISEKIPEGYEGLDIAVLELLALNIFLDKVDNNLSDSTVTWKIDNQAVLFAIKNKGLKDSWPLNHLSCVILEKAEKRGLVFEPVRISLEENFIADAGSRFKRVPEWLIKTSLVQNMFQLWGTADVDLMATTLSRKCPVFFPWNREDVEAWGLDSISKEVDWSQFTLPYIFPPFPLIPQVLNKVLEQKVEKIMMILPYWQNKPWFSLASNMAMKIRRLPFRDDQVIDTRSGKPPQELKRTKLSAWLITGKSDRKDEHFQKRQCISLNPPGEKEHKTNTIADGRNTVVDRKFHQLRLI